MTTEQLINEVLAAAREYIHAEDAFNAANRSGRDPDKIIAQMERSFRAKRDLEWAVHEYDKELP